MPTDPNSELDELIVGFEHDPVGHALASYPWGEGELADSQGPRQWQQDILQHIGDHLSNPKTRHMPCQVAVTSGHGIGKSALIGMIVTWAMDTCVETRIVVTANTDTQLRTKTWPEVCKWRRLALTSSWFEPTATSIYQPGASAKEWRADAIPWSENNTEAFAGLHNKGKRIVVIFDEASSISDKIWEVTEGALTDEDTEIIWIAFGNPTRNTGRFRECFRRYRHRWNTRQIDSRQVEGTNKALFDTWVTDHGEDSDFVKVRVRGMFPAMSARQFISEVDVDAAFGKHLKPDAYNWAPKIITCDPAWTGDDTLEIGMRQGLAFKLLKSIPRNDNDVAVANILAQLEDDHQADAVFVDGGYGTGIVSVGRTLGRDWVIVWFGEKSSDPGCVNKRAEMWNSMKKWLQEGGAIPADQQLRDDLLGPETVPRLDGKILIEPKESMKLRGLPSPNKADSLALSFAHPVHKRTPIEEMRDRLEGGRGINYDPLKDF